MDTESLLRSLNAHRVRYVVIGATAFPVHGYARATLDIDIFIDPTPANARRTLAALAAIGYDVSDVTETDLLTKKLLIRQYALETDIHPFVAGVTFATVWRNRVRSRIGTASAGFARLGDLIRMKRAAQPAQGSGRSPRPPHVETWHPTTPLRIPMPRNDRVPRQWPLMRHLEAATRGATLPDLAADLRELDHRTLIGRQDGTGFGAIHGQRQMCAPAPVAGTSVTGPG